MKIPGRVLLVGSVPRESDGWSAEEVFRHCGPVLGDRVSMLPDGEVGDRHWWIVMLAYRVFSEHPDIEVLSRPRPVETYLGEKVSSWKGKDYDDPWLFKVKDGVQKIRFDTLRYADGAKASYAIFRRLRKEGVIAPKVRFQVCLPLIESAIRWFLTTNRDFQIMWEAYEEAMRREIKSIVNVIPPDDLAIQWDIYGEVDSVEGSETWGTYAIDGDPLERYQRALAALSPGIPGEAWLGLHICYGSLGHRHFVEPKDLGVCVRMANAGIAAAGRHVDFIHMPVPLDRDDDAYFAPLKDLKAVDARVYLGLIHYKDGVEGARRRAAAARRYLPEFGIATECGFARRPPDQDIDRLLVLHAEIADALADAGADAR